MNDFCFVVFMDFIPIFRIFLLQKISRANNNNFVYKEEPESFVLLCVEAWDGRRWVKADPPPPPHTFFQLRKLAHQLKVTEFGNRNL